MAPSYPRLVTLPASLYMKGLFRVTLLIDSKCSLFFQSFNKNRDFFAKANILKMKYYAIGKR